MSSGHYSIIADNSTSYRFSPTVINHRNLYRLSSRFFRKSNRKSPPGCFINADGKSASKKWRIL